MGLTVRVPGKRQSIYMSIFCCLSWQRLAYWASGYEGSLTPVKGKQNIQIKVVGPRLLLLQNSQFLRRWTSHKVWCSHRSRRTRVVQRYKLAQSCLHWGQLWSYPSFLSFSQLKYRCCALSHVWLFVTPWTVAHQAPLTMGLSRQEYWSRLPCPPPKAPRYRYWGGDISLSSFPLLYLTTFFLKGILTSASKIAPSQLFQPPGFSSPWSLTGPFWHAPHPPRPLPLSAAHLHISHCVISPTSLVSLPTGFWWLPASSVTSKFLNLNFPFEPQICVAN